MLKYLLLILNFFILFVAPTFQAVDTVNVSNAHPAVAKPGSSFTVEVTVKKGAVGGFAKLQEELPVGLTASAGEGKGGTFTFVDQKVKFVWVSLPADAEFKISYKVTVAPDAAGSKTFGGTFSYLENNESRKFNITAGSVMVSNDPNAALAAAAPEPTPAPTPEASPTPAPEPTAAETPATTPSSSETPSPSPNEAVGSNPVTAPTNGVEIIRTMPATIPLSQKEFVVELLVKKQKINGFAKIQDDLPEGFTATAMETKGATFSFASQKVKFVWMSLPPSEEFKISYKITVDPGATGTKSIDGLFSFLDNSESKKYIIPTASIGLGGAATPEMAKENPKPESNPIGQAADTAKAQPKVAKSAGRTKSGESNGPAVSKLANIPTPVSGIEFKIQVSAAKKEISNPSDFFKNTYNFTESVNAEMHEGWHKYTSGSFPYYVKAHDFRNDAWGKGIKGSFVVAYNSGTRITVQEALLITKQKWVQ
jgi:hypothetical protein